MTSRQTSLPSSLSPLARRLLLDAPKGRDFELPRAGSSLELIQVHDAVAREFIALADLGQVTVVRQHEQDGLISQLIFRRNR